MRTNGLLLPFALLTASTLVGQDLAEMQKQLEYRLTAEGKIQLKPDPSAGGDGAGFTDIVDPGFLNFFQNGGVTGWLALVYQGDTDIASLADAGLILDRLGKQKDAQVLAAIAAQPKTHVERLMQLLAIRAAQHRGLAAAVPVLEREIAAGIADPHTALAAREALAALRGREFQHPGGQLRGLKELLGTATGGLDYVLHYDLRKMPPAHNLLRWGRMLGMANTEAEIKRAGGAVSLPSVAGMHLIAEAPSIAPYELARRFGNHRVTRIVGFGRVPSADEPEGANWLHIDGLFDPDRLREGLTPVVPLELEGKPGQLEYEDDTHRFALTRTLATARPHNQEPAMATKLDVQALLAQMGPLDATLTLFLRKGVEIPGLPPQVARLGIPRRVSIWLPAKQRDELRLQIVCATSQLATTIEGQIKDLPRLLDRQVEQETAEVGTLMEPVLDALDAMKLHREKATVTVSVNVDGIDVQKMVDAACKMLRSR